jgi:hypothetical protein
VPPTTGSGDSLIEGLDALHRSVSTAQRDMLGVIAEVDARELWRDSGARDMASWLCIRYGISLWKARRWVAASHALEALPRLRVAFTGGLLGIDKVVELTRFATPATEARLVPWAQQVSCGHIRRTADRALRPSTEEVVDAEHSRRLSWWYTDEGARFGLEADLPAAQGAVVARALQRLADTIPVMPGEEDWSFADARRADALVAMCSARVGDETDPDRATVIIHASAPALAADAEGCQIEGGPVIHPEIVRRLLCHGRSQVVVERDPGHPVRVGRIRREPPAWMMRQLRYRDAECRFPGCGARRFTQAHHIVWWGAGGTTDLDNLVLICTFHHKLVHELGWSLSRGADGALRWARPNGVRYRAGPAPPTDRIDLDRTAVPAGNGRLELAKA